MAKKGFNLGQKLFLINNENGNMSKASKKIGNDDKNIYKSLLRQGLKLKKSTDKNISDYVLSFRDDIK